MAYHSSSAEIRLVDNPKPSGQFMGWRASGEEIMGYQHVGCKGIISTSIKVFDNSRINKSLRDVAKTITIIINNPNQ